MPEQYKNKVVLVTGGASGIGRGIVEAFAAEGAKVALSYYASEDDAQGLAREIRGWQSRATLPIQKGRRRLSPTSGRSSAR